MTYWFVVDDILYVVDPGDLDFLRSLNQKDYVECRVLVTHAHFDHIYGLPSLLDWCPETIIFTNDKGAEALKNPKLNLSKYNGNPIYINENAKIRLVETGDSICHEPSIIAVHTPGHHPSCICWMIEGECVFTGDSFIPGIPVVTKMPFADKELALAWEKRLSEVSKEKNLQVLPGHYVVEE